MRMLALRNTQNDAQAVLTAKTVEAKILAAENLAQNWAKYQADQCPNSASQIQAQAQIQAQDSNQHPLNTTPSEPQSLQLMDRPNRPDKPILISPRDIPRRGLGKIEGRISLLHAVAHIEFNAIDLAADMICRFSNDPLLEPNQKQAFLSDWISVCADEARHFTLINERLNTLGATYGDHPAHDGLWEAALSTRTNLLARLVIAPMVLEARGLDVTPSMIHKLNNVKDTESAKILQIIYDDEIGHVAIGSKWFHLLCDKTGKDPEIMFQNLVKKHFLGRLKPPFNIEARLKAGLPTQFYTSLV